MPVHEWSKVEAGIFHAFHCSWITHLMGAMNGGVLPSEYYALAEQHAGLTIPDLMTLHRVDRKNEQAPNGGVALIDAPPRVGRRLVASSKTTYATMRRTLTVRRSPGDRLVAIVEIVSPGNKDRNLRWRSGGEDPCGLGERSPRSFDRSLRAWKRSPVGRSRGRLVVLQPGSLRSPPYQAPQRWRATSRIGSPRPMWIFSDSVRRFRTCPSSSSRCAHVLLPLDATYTWPRFGICRSVYQDILK